MTWSASTDDVGVTGYQVERCQGSGCTTSFTQFNVGSNSWANTGLTPSTTYGYRVRAKDAVPNYSGYTNIVYATTPAAGDTQAPTTPTGLTAVASSSTTVVVNWNASTDNVEVTGYQLERCQGSGCTSSFTQVDLSSPGWANTGLTPSTTYGYRVRAKDAVPNYSAFTSIVYATTDAAAGDTQAPTVPTNLTAAASSSTGIVVNWNASTDNVAVAGYDVDVCQGSGCTSSFTTYGSSGAGRAITGLTASTTYGVRVRAKDAVPNYSAYTSIVYVTTQAGADTTAPSVPTSFTASASSSTDVVLSWAASTDNVAVTGYQVERCQGSGCTSSFTAFDLTSAGWTDTSLTASTTYGYRVRAKDAVPNYSAFTSIVYVTTQAAGDTQAPTVPNNFTAVASSSTTVVLNWSASTDNVGVTGYQVDRCQGSGCTSSFTTFNLSSPGWANSGLTAATTYGYRLRAKDAVPNYSGYTNIVYVTTDGTGDTQAPTVPASFTATASSSTDAVLNWSASTDNVGVTGYQIERCQGSGCNSSFTQFSATSTGWVNTGLSASTTYGYRIRALDAVPNYSAFTSIVYVTTAAGSNDTQAPSVPGSLSATANSSSQVTVGWSASTDNVAVTGYQLERCVGSGCNSSFSQFNVTSTSYTDTGRTASTTYGYRVRAKDAVPNYSAFSSIAYVTTPAAGDSEAPSIPGNVTVSASNGGLTLVWQAAADNVGVTAYLIDRCLASSCTYAQIASVTTTSYTDTSVTAETYRYRIRARDAAGNLSEYSSAVTGSTAAGAEIRNYISYEYDAAGRLRRANHPDAKQIAYTLDAAGNRKQVQNAVPPDAPQSLTVPDTSTSGSYTVSWVGPAGQTVTSYQLFEATQSDFNNDHPVDRPDPSTTSASITGKAEGDYYYRVRACYQSVCSPFLAKPTPIKVGFPPGMPASLTLPAGTNYTGSYTVTWGAASGNFSRYELYESTNSTFNPQTLVYSSSGQSFTATNRAIGEYYYQVRACSSTTCGAYRTTTAHVTVVEPVITLDNVTVNSGGSISQQPSTEHFIGASYQVLSSGALNVERYGQFGSIEGWTHNSWISATEAINQYEVRASTTTCNQTPQYSHADGVYDTWINLASAHAGWGVSLFTPDYSVGCQITIQIRKASQPSVIVKTGVVDISLWSEQ